MNVTVLFQALRLFPLYEGIVRPLASRNYVK